MRRYSGVGDFHRWLDAECKRREKEMDRIWESLDGGAEYQEYCRGQHTEATAIWNKFVEMVKKGK